MSEACLCVVVFDHCVFVVLDRVQGAKYSPEVSPHGDQAEVLPYSFGKVINC